MIIADTLSRLSNPEKNAGISLDVTVDDIMTDENDKRLHNMDLINFRTGKRVQLRELSASDHTMHAEYSNNGVLHDKLSQSRCKT